MRVTLYTQIFNYLSSQSEPKTVQEVSKNVNITGHQAGAMLSKMSIKGLVESIEVTTDVQYKLKKWRIPVERIE